MFLFFPFIFISWRLINLQYCGGFCHTLAWISYGFTCVPHPEPPSHLPPHPIPLSSPLHQPRALVSCIQPGLAICFTLDSILVLMLFSQIIPPSPLLLLNLLLVFKMETSLLKIFTWAWIFLFFFKFSHALIF